jgi:hypothetical protein
VNRLFGGNFGDYVVEEDWDNLIILDACRYDLFAECNTIDGTLHRFHSRGSHTGEFVQQNFGDQEFPDIVYIDSNPNPMSVDMGFAAAIEVWDSGWDEQLHTVPPETMVEYTLKANVEYPHKRLISHFLQPHYPWVGPRGQEFMADHGYVSQHAGNEHVWIQLEKGELDRDTLWEMYKENLEVTLPYVAELIDNLNGKTVVTSDHGNAFGEYGVYGHPPQYYIPPLVKVPWLEVPHSERKEIRAKDETERFGRADISEDQLRDLGYL